MHARREGRRPGPDREPVLRETWKAVIGQLGGDVGGSNLVIGGKSMGGRIASLIADEAGVRGLVCLGYPFHPAGQPGKTRTAHLAGLRTPALVVQGTRDALGSREDVAGYTLSPALRILWLEDGDHSFKPRVSSGHSEAGHLRAAIAAVAQFVRDLH
jgi:predicted alpha/beta-hydrolase family hydrolase